MTPRKKVELPKQSPKAAAAFERLMDTIGAGFNEEGRGGQGSQAPPATTQPQAPRFPEGEQSPQSPKETERPADPIIPEEPRALLETEESRVTGFLARNARRLAKSQDPAWSKVGVYLRRQTRQRADVICAQYTMDLSDLAEEGLRRLVVILDGEGEDPAMDLLEQIIKEGLTPEIRRRAKEIIGA